MRQSSFALALIVGAVLSTASCRAQEASRGLKLDRQGQTIVLEPYAPNILRVTLSLTREPAQAAPGYGIAASPAASGWSASRNEKADTYQSAGMVVTVDRPQPSTTPPVQTQVDIGKYFNGSTPGAHITFRTATARSCWN